MRAKRSARSSKSSSTRADISGILVGIGLFLGLGERYVSLSQEVVLTPQGDRSCRAAINTTRENLKNAPEFKFEGAQSR